ncbi:hypothetical protein Tco_1134531 [Tanacetum coccineum]
MIPLSKARVFRIMLDGKRPHPQTPMESSESQSQSPTPHQEEENDLNSSKPRECSSALVISSLTSGRRSKGVLQGVMRFLLTPTKTAASGSLCSKSGSIEPMEPRMPVLQ